MSRRRRAFLLAAAIVVWATPAFSQPPNAGLGDSRARPEPLSNYDAVIEAAVGLPIAAALGAALAFRPRRRGTPPRTPAVIQTQIILAVVGALVMLIVGSSLARAFGIVGAAGLIRYRAKIEDPKDAGVMLATLGVGLASGVRLYLLAGFGTLFFLVVLWLIESLDEGRQPFVLRVGLEGAGSWRGRLESVLKRERVEYELRSSSEKELCYAVKLPLDRSTELVSNAILRAAGGRAPAVQWEEKD